MGPLQLVVCTLHVSEFVSGLAEAQMDELVSRPDGTAGGLAEKLQGLTEVGVPVVQVADADQDPDRRIPDFLRLGQQLPGPLESVDALPISATRQSRLGLLAQPIRAGADFRAKPIGLHELTRSETRRRSASALPPSLQGGTLF